jgi:hypothetical protein
MGLSRAIVFTGKILLSAMLLCSGFAQSIEVQEVIGRSRAAQTEAMSLFKELYLVEDSVLFPNRQQLRIYVTQPFGSLVKMNQLKLTFNSEPIAEHSYVPDEIKRFISSAHQHMVTLMIPAGEHKLGVRATGELGRRGVLEGELVFKKGEQPKFIEITIRRTSVRFREWE